MTVNLRITNINVMLYFFQYIKYAGRVTKNFFAGII